MQTVKMTEFGDHLRICVYTRATRWDSPKAKTVKGEWRKRANQILSLRLTRDKLEARIACNFGPGDWHAVLTLSDQYYTTDYTVMRECWRRFIDTLSHSRRRRGAAAPVYIYVMEGLHGDKRLHIHALFQAVDGDIEELQRYWRYGEVFLTRLEDFDHRDSLAQYLTKEPAKFGRDKLDRNLFVASHNCQKPKVSSQKWPDEVPFVLPEGYRLERDSEVITNGYGRFAYYDLTRIR